jgi:ribonuclease BN (tRNA processing enzyme)
MLIDCGSGALGKLRSVRDYRDIDAIVISHFHADHLLDLIPFACALTYGPAASEGLRTPRLIGPAGIGAYLAQLGSAIGDPALIVGAFALEEHVAGTTVAVGELAVTAHSVVHIGPTNAIEVDASPGRIVFGADGRYSDELVRAASRADVLIAEATLAEPDPSQEIHMSAAEAGRLAAEAGVGRLVLTHISDELDLGFALDAARSAFSGPVEIAAEGASYEV